MTSVIRAEKERDKAMQEARAAQLVATMARDAKARVEVDLTKALNSLAAAEEGGCRTTTISGLLGASRTTTVSGLLGASRTTTVSGLLGACRTTTVSGLLGRSNCRF